MTQNLIGCDYNVTSANVIEQEWQKFCTSGKLHMMCYASVSFREWGRLQWCEIMDLSEYRDYQGCDFDRYSKELTFLPKLSPGLKLIEKELHPGDRFDFTPVQTCATGFYFREWQIRRLYRFCQRMDHEFSNMQLDIYHGCAEWIETFVQHGVDIKDASDIPALPQKLQFELSSLIGVPVLCFESISIDESTNTVRGKMKGQHIALIPAYRFILDQWPLDLQQQTRAVKDLQKIATDFTYPPNNWLIG